MKNKKAICITLAAVFGLLIHNIGFAQTNAQKLQIQAATNVSFLNQLAASQTIISTQEKQLCCQVFFSPDSFKA